MFLMDYVEFMDLNFGVTSIATVYFAGCMLSQLFWPSLSFSVSWMFI